VASGCWFALPQWLKPPEPGVSRSLEETEAFMRAAAAQMSPPILALLVVHGISVSGGIAVLLKLLGGPDVR
jgi:uncharacterized membrane protein YphA (DoxX/SURF4 family)